MGVIDFDVAFSQTFAKQEHTQFCAFKSLWAYRCVCLIKEKKASIYVANIIYFFSSFISHKLKNSKVCVRRMVRQVSMKIFMLLRNMKRFFIKKIYVVVYYTYLYRI